MKAKAGQLVVRAGVLLLLSLTSIPLYAQAPGAVLSGTVTDPSSKAVPGARISVKNLATGQSTETQTDLAGLYEARDLLSGDYEVSVTAEGFSTKTDKVTIPTAGRQTMNFTLQKSLLSLEDLGFSLTQAQGSAQDQARLDKRSHMLKLHQRFGLIAAVPLAATVLSGPGGKSTSSTSRDIHAALGLTSVTLYSISAYYSIAAPKIPGTRTHGNIRLHKALAWVHGAGMIATPILGDLAYQQRRRGEKVHGIASAHSTVGIVTVVAYAAAILTESFK